MFLKKNYINLFNLTVSQIIRKRITFSAPAALYHHRVYDMEKKPDHSVFITTKIDEEAKKILKDANFDVHEWTAPEPIPKNNLIRELEGKDALFCTLNDKVDDEVLSKVGTKLKVIATMSVGYDHLSLKDIKTRNIKIGYTPGILTEATAELTLALLLATSRRLFEANNAVKNGEWHAWAPYWMCGPGIKGSTIGIVGLGRIGQQVARLIKPFNPKSIIFYSRSLKEVQSKILNLVQVDFETLLKDSDFIILTCALTDETKNLFNDKAFSKMKKNAVFINTSRGGIVDQGALVKALKSNLIFGAGLDVMTPEPLPLNHELLQLKNCVILPHIGSAAIQTRQEMAKITVQNIIAAIKDEPMPSELIVDC
ncbi:glyoxylate reductase/hydroxypyruvate reductase [Agrilus planipennis]|uniref:Glyoxylate reductase/hydroxypyruvate reductase n=1 Tax=Agrilus planipennis TaxID=224129 RepID=A0A1W4WIM2_AGRPL|nr:glyoxylate reductase/hydroxypyruvate reductase [Agrilus planipennis]